MKAIYTFFIAIALFIFCNSSLLAQNDTNITQTGGVILTEFNSRVNLN